MNSIKKGNKKSTGFSWPVMKIRGRLISGYVFLYLCLFGYAALFTSDVRKVALEQALHETMDVAAMMAKAITSQSNVSNIPPLFYRQAELQDFILSLRYLEYQDIEIINAEKKVIADVVYEDVGMILQGDLGDVVDKVLHGGSSVETFRKITETKPDGLMLLVIPLEVKGSVVGALILDYMTGLQMNQEIAEGRIKLLWLTLLIPALMIFIVYFMVSRTIIQPLGELVDATHRIGSGELDFPIARKKSKDEIGDLYKAFDVMRLKLKASIDRLGQEVVSRKQAESELRVHRDALEKTVEIRTKDLEEARDAALLSSQVKSDFIANVSHEIRTPLTPIIGFAETIIQDNPDEKIRNSLLHSIIRNGRHLFNVINGILDLSKIEANKLEIEKIEVDTSQLFNDVESVIGTMAREKGIEFRKAFVGPVPRCVICDPTRVKQILMNLLTNAIKFTEKGHIDLHLEFNSERRLLHFTISDTGIGVPQEKLDKLFQAFSQADSSISRRFGGTGLGLHISKHLAMLMGGDITVQSVQNVGTKFSVEIPVESNHLNDLISFPDEVASLSAYSNEFSNAIPKLAGHILLAEDSPDNQRLIGFYISRTGARVSTAENGKIAFEMAMANDYDLILMDMQMPIMDGEAAVAMLRSCGCNVPIVALTANAMKGDREKYTKIGCNDFLGKPIKQSAFYHYLAKYMPKKDDQADNKVKKNIEEDPEFEAIKRGFLNTINDHLETLQMAMSQQDYQTIKEQAHVLNGTGGSFGYFEITEHAATVEKAIKANQYDQGMELCRALCNVLKKYIPA